MTGTSSFEITQDEVGNPLLARNLEDFDHPTQIGRYKIQSVLGVGAFGIVYLALDHQLDRLVTIKVPHPRLITRPDAADAYLAEARTVAKLDHPQILQVHDVGTAPDYPCYIVSQYMPGNDLFTHLQEKRLSYHESALLIASVSGIMYSAHRLGFVHRDIKPSNILIGTDGKAYLLDFGLALREENVGKGPEYIGTPSYMSPEQARGEGHRVDGRSDIFSLGVVLYELLTGQKPFRGKTRESLLSQIVNDEPTPIRHYDVQIPQELERICHKMMAKRAADRYASAKILVGDLRSFLRVHPFDGDTIIETRPLFAEETFLELGNSSLSRGASFSGTPESTPTPISEFDSEKVIPKGLRAYDAHDANFFLKLLPGPTDRYGLPESLRFWITRIENFTLDNTFEIGVIYGPSGCGKSSLVKAGLQPRLSRKIQSCCIEATPQQTEPRLLKTLQSRFPDLNQELSLSEAMSVIRRGKGLAAGSKLLIIIDQFEQWLSVHSNSRNTELIRALRHCDGLRIQCLLLVRDDFWLSLSRFLHELEVQIIGGQNCMYVDLFTPEHAKTVLCSFGQAYGRLPENPDNISVDQQHFLHQATSGLMQSGKVICVQLALFAEMMKSKTWNTNTLQKVGGAEGIGTTFLEDTFDIDSASPEHRYHQEAARSVLKCLLPKPGCDIRGEMKDVTELLKASGYERRPEDFENLIRILDSELRLITPTSLELTDSPYSQLESLSEEETEQKYYQLTHDYLVHSLRNWLTKKQQETPKGRAELKLAGMTALWSVSQENRYLPSWWEHLRIRFLTDRKTWTRAETMMMSHSARRYRRRSLWIIVCCALLICSLFAIRSVWLSSLRNQEVALLVNGLLHAETTEIPSILIDLESHREWVHDHLVAAYESHSDDSQAKLHAALALLPHDDSVLDYLQQRLLSLPAEDFITIRTLLDSQRSKLVPVYIETATDVAKDSQTRFQAACALAAYPDQQELWEDQAFCEFVCDYLVHEPSSDVHIWRKAFRPQRQSLIAALRAEFSDPKESEQARYIATETLIDYLQGQPQSLFELLLQANSFQFTMLSEALLRYPTDAVRLAKQTLANPIPQTVTVDQREVLMRRQAFAGLLLLKMNQTDEVWPLLRHSSSPTIRTIIINSTKQVGVDPLILIDRFYQEKDVSCQRALLLALGGYSPNHITVNIRLPFQKHLLAMYPTEPDPGLHAAAFWLLRRWGWEPELELAEQRLQLSESELRAETETARQWYVNTQGQTFVILEAEDFRMGSPDSEPHRRPNETAHTRQLNRRFAIAVTEVTKSQWRKFEESQADYVWSVNQTRLDAYFPTEDSPFAGMTWFQAVRYCNWLSEQEGIPQSQWCYESREGNYKPGMQTKENFLELIGYRLPTEAEWEYACRGGTVTSRFFGESNHYLHEYAWYLENAEDHTWPVRQLKPNDWGLFDMYGNAYEWCHSKESTYDRRGGKMLDQINGIQLLKETPRRILRGGSFSHPAAYLRSADRNMNPPNDQNYRLAFGFRPVRTF